MKFAINRLDMSGAAEFAASAGRAESLGWHMGLIPCNPLSAPDPYVSLALAAQQTRTLHLGTLLDTPVLRHPSVLAGSIATVAALAPGRVHLGLGVGDTAVRFNALAPASVASLRESVLATRSFLAGDRVDVGAAKPARLRHAKPVPVWIAAQGPKTLRMAGALADGVFIRVGTHPANLRAAWQAVCEGAHGAGRAIDELEVGLIFHTVVSDDADEARLIAKSVAAGYFEYSQFLFDAPGFDWNGPDVEELKKQVWPDFLHHPDPTESGRAVDFLGDAVADAFALHGDWPAIERQLGDALAVDIPASIVLPHPVLPPRSPRDYLSECAERLITAFAD